MNTFVKRLSICVIFFSLFLIFSHNFRVVAQERSLVSMMLHTAEGNFLYEKRSITINLNGQILPEIDMPPIIIENRTFVPVRHVLESMGAVVDFHSEHQRIMIAYHDDLIVMHIGQNQFSFNDTVLTMDVAPQIINDRTLAPVSFIANALGFDVYWENESATVYLTAPLPPVTQAILPPADPGLPPFLVTIDDGDDDYDDYHHNHEAVMPSAPDSENINFIALSNDITAIPIVHEANPETSVHHVSWNDERTQFAITAAERITWVSWQMLEDGRLFVDVHNAVSDFAQSSYTVNNGFLSTIRTGQQKANGVNISRIVFDLTAPVVYGISISEDRHNVLVTFEQNTITHINFANTFDALGRESIVVTGTTAPAVDAFMLYSPLRLVMDIPNAALAPNFTTDLAGSGRFIDNIQFSQFNETTVRVVAHLSYHPAFSVQLSGNTATIHITEPTFRNIYYNADTNTIEITKPPIGFGVNQILEFERYLDLLYLFVLPGDFSAHFGYGEFVIRHNSLRVIEISTENGMTTLTFNTSQIMAYDIWEDAERIFIRPIHPKERYDFIVLLDPGHGGSASGAVRNGVREADLNLDTTLMVLEMLQADGIVRAYMTRYTDVTVANSHRAAMANQTADIFVSIHYNAVANTGVRGTETLYFVTEHENQTGFNSRSLARIMQDQKIAELGLNDRGLQNRPGILVLNQTRIPAVLLEIGFMSNPEEFLLLIDPAHQRRAAEAIVRGIYEAMEIYAPRR